jgi:hypothetical protein
MYTEFIKERLQTQRKNITDVLHRNRLLLFKEKPDRANSRVNKVKVLKNDMQLFSRLFVSCQTRVCNLEEFFRHENQPFPPSLSDANGCVRK